MDHRPSSASLLVEVGDWIERRTPSTVVIGSLVLVFVMGWIDYLSGPAVAFSMFYLLPISAIAWKYRRRLAILVSVLAALTWLAADLSSGEMYRHWWIPAWNTASRFGVFVLVAALIDLLRSAMREQSVLARTDALTGVDNARSFIEHAQKLLEEMRLHRTPLTLAYLDVDDFKRVNDTLGHGGGDALLRSIGSSLRIVIRTTDRVGRLGGDEFALLLPETGSAGARRMLEELQARVRQSLDGDARPLFSMSLGAVTFLVPPNDVDEMIAVADDLMYQAKQAGKATYRHVTVGEGVSGAIEDRSNPRSRRNRTETSPA